MDKAQSPETTEVAEVRGPFSVPGFPRYAAGRVLSSLGRAVSLVALPVLVYAESGSPVLTGLVAAAESLPYLVLGLFAGAMVDRRDARRMLAGACVVSGLAMLTVPLAQAIGVLSVAHVLVVAFSVGTALVFADAAAFGVLPRLVGRDHVGLATARLSSIDTIIGIAVPGVAGVLLVVVSAPYLVGIDGVLALMAAATLLGLPWRHRSSEPVEEGPPASLLHDIREGLGYIWRHPVIGPLTFLGFGNSFTGGAVAGLLVVAAVQRLGMTQDDGRIGLLYAASGAGAFLGSLVIYRLQKFVPVGVITLLGYAGVTVLTLVLGATTNWWVFLAVLFAGGVVSVMVILNGVMVRQTIAPMRLQARINTTARVIAWGGSPLGAAAGGALAGMWGVDTALYICAAAVGMALAIGVVAGVPRLGLLRDLTPVDID
jgi:MFS family permease